MTDTSLMPENATHILVNATATYALRNVRASQTGAYGPAIEGAFTPIFTREGRKIDCPWLAVGLFPLDSSTTIIPITPR